MLKRVPAPPLLAAALLALSARSASAVTVDGSLDAEYGSPLSTQTTQTGAGDNFGAGTVWGAFGSELDQAYGFVADGVLHLFFTGDLLYEPGAELAGRWHPLDLFIDSTPGGQNQLLSNNPVIVSYYYDANMMAGLTFDAGFEPDHWLSCGTVLFAPLLRAYYGALPTGGGGAGYYLGYSNPGGPGTLSGGTNPFGIEVAINDSNTGGVAAGCGAASGAGVTTGIEWAIPLAAIGNPTGCIKVCAFVNSEDHSSLMNQVLGPLPPGTCNLGAASAVNFANIPGPQYFSICPTTPALRATWGSLKAIYR